MTTTPSTASQAPAVSILQDHEFMRALEAFADTFPRSGKEALIDFGKKSDYALIQIIDAKLAQAKLRGMELADEKVFQPDMDEWKARATAAEAKLEAIRMAIDGLARFYTVGDEPVEYPDSDFLMYKDVSALFQPQPQADESGLPG